MPFIIKGQDCVCCISNTDLIELECQHGLCHECGQKWFNKSSVCPICKRELSRESLSEDFGIATEQETTLMREISNDYVLDELTFNSFNLFNVQDAHMANTDDVNNDNTNLTMYISGRSRYRPYYMQPSSPSISIGLQPYGGSTLSPLYISPYISPYTSPYTSISYALPYLERELTNSMQSVIDNMPTNERIILNMIHSAITNTEHN